MTGLRFRLFCSRLLIVGTLIGFSLSGVADQGSTTGAANARATGTALDASTSPKPAESKDRTPASQPPKVDRAYALAQAAKVRQSSIGCYQVSKNGELIAPPEGTPRNGDGVDLCREANGGFTFYSIGAAPQPIVLGRIGPNGQTQVETHPRDFEGASVPRLRLPEFWPALDESGRPVSLPPLSVLGANDGKRASRSTRQPPKETNGWMWQDWTGKYHMAYSNMAYTKDVVWVQEVGRNLHLLLEDPSGIQRTVAVVDRSDLTIAWTHERNTGIDYSNTPEEKDYWTYLRKGRLAFAPGRSVYPGMKNLHAPICNLGDQGTLVSGVCTVHEYIAKR